MITELIIVAIILIIFWIKRGQQNKADNFPPGPWGLPLLGHLHLLGYSPHKTLLTWKKQYGPLIGVRFGSFRTLVINDMKLIREALSYNEFACRPKFNLFHDRSGGKPKGIACSSGELWSEQRRFTMRNLRDFGYGTKSMESKIKDEVVELLDEIKSAQGNPILIDNFFNMASINCLWSILLGERKDVQDPEFKKAVHSLSEFFHGNNFLASLSMYMPWLAKIAPKWSGYSKMLQYPYFMLFLGKEVKQHQRSYVPGQPRGLVDSFEDEARRTTDKSSSFHREHKAVFYALVDLFVGGAETTSTTLTFLLAYLVTWPQVQKKLQKEIDLIVGRNQLPSLSHRPSMPYLEAVLSETLRYSSMAPFALFHSTSKAVEFQGYTIPKDTMVAPNLYAAHHDPEVWGDPQNFRPERFISAKDGKFLKNENLIPFATGKRVCIGEGLAKDQLFLFVSHLFQKFEALPIPGKMPELEPIVGMVLLLRKFEVIFKERSL